MEASSWSQIETKFATLASGAKTDVFTVGENGELWAEILSVTVAAGTGVAGTATVAIWKTALALEKVVIFQGAVGANIPLSLVGMPATHLERGDIVRVTGAANQEVCVTYSYGTRAVDTKQVVRTGAIPAVPPPQAAARR